MIQSNRLLALPLLILALAAGVRAAPEPLATLAQVHQQFDDAKYHDAVRAISRITASRDWEARKKVEKFELLSLKAESHLRLKESTLAAVAFDIAAKEAPDKAGAGFSRSMAYLIKHSTGTNYVPRATANKHVPGKKPQDHPTIDILEPDSRKQALTALWQDEKNAAESKLQAASDGRSVQAVIDATPLLARLRDFDFAANGNDDDTAQKAMVIAAHGRDLLTDMVDRMTTRVDVIYSKAYDLDTVKVYNVDRWRKHGLEALEPNELTEIVSRTESVLQAAKLLGEGLATEADYFARVTKEAKRIHEKSQKLLKTDYSETFSSARAAKE